MATRDISERKAAEEALARANAELETLLQVLPIGIGVAADPGITDIRMNPAFARMLGLPPDANASLAAPLVERPITFRAFQGGRELAVEELPLTRAAATGREVRDLEIELVRADGATHTQLAYAAPLFDAEGGVRGAVAAFLDITGRVRAERQRGLLLAGMADDLKNTLAALSWLGQTLQRQEGRLAAAERARMLEALVQGTQQMTGQINDLLDAALLQMGRSQALHLREVVYALSCVEEATASWAVIRVADRGIGIPAGEVDRAFKPYFRPSRAVPSCRCRP